METSDTLFVEMAEQALENLDEQLNSAICLDTYTEPKNTQMSNLLQAKNLWTFILSDTQNGSMICLQVLHMLFLTVRAEDSSIT